MRLHRSAGGVLGLDLSLTRTAAVVIPATWQPCEWGDIRSRTFGGPLEKGPSAQELADRVCGIARGVVEYAREFGVRHVYAEGYTFGAFGASHYQLAELGGAVLFAFAQKGMLVRRINVSTARKYLLGMVPKKNPKPVVRSTLERAGLHFATDDEYDAFVVANAGLGVCLGRVGVVCSTGDDAA